MRRRRFLQLLTFGAASASAVLRAFAKKPESSILGDSRIPLYCSWDGELPTAVPALRGGQIVYLSVDAAETGCFVKVDACGRAAMCKSPAGNNVIGICLGVDKGRAKVTIL